MFGGKNQREKTIMTIINIEKNIKCIYDNMNLQNKDSLEKELRVEIAKENYLLDSLNLKESNSKEIYVDFVNLLNESLTEDFTFELKDESLKGLFHEYKEIVKKEQMYINSLVLSRFESYLIMRFRNKPTKSKERIDNSKRRKEDRATINHAAAIDYQTSTVRFLKELFDNTDSLGIANRAISEINRNLFTDKHIEEKYLNNDLSITKKDECLKAGFNEEYVNEIYDDFIRSAINEQARHCYLISNKDMSEKENIPRITTEFQKLKASLYLIDQESLKENLNNYQNLNMTNGKKSVQMMVATMQEVIYLKENEKGFVKTKKVIG